jgi:hypothetical protein
MPLDPAEPGFAVRQRRGHAALLLVAGPPVIDLGGPLFDLGEDRLEPVRGLEADVQGARSAEAVERDGLLHSLLQALDRRGVDELEFLREPPERRLGLRGGGLRVYDLELPLSMGKLCGMLV